MPVIYEQEPLFQEKLETYKQTQLLKEKINSEQKEIGILKSKVAQEEKDQRQFFKLFDANMPKNAKADSVSVLALKESCKSLKGSLDQLIAEEKEVQAGLGEASKKFQEIDYMTQKARILKLRIEAAMRRYEPNAL